MYIDWFYEYFDDRYCCVDIGYGCNGNISWIIGFLVGDIEYRVGVCGYVFLDF